MRKPMTAEGAPIDTRVPRTFFSRMFRWGICFWLLMWIGATCVRSGAACGIKGLPPAKLIVRYGSVWCGMDLDRASPANTIEVAPVAFIWSPGVLSPSEEPYLDRPKDFLFLLGPFTTFPNHVMVFPVSGFLWLWLVWGWWLEPKRKEVWSRKGVVRIAILVLLPAMSMVANHSYKQRWDLSRCHLNIRNIQLAVRGRQSTREWLDGAPLPWNEIFGPGGLMNKPRCPSGGEYELSPVVPELGKPAARCRNPEHQRSLEELERKNPRIW